MDKVDTPAAPAVPVVETPVETDKKSSAGQPNFDALSATTHQVTPGAAQALGDTAPAPEVQKPASRGSKPLRGKDREAAREKKRQRDRERYAKEKNKSATPAQQAQNLNAELGIAQANAAMICAALDLLAKGISGGEYVAGPEQRAATTGAWAAYLHSEGLQLPPWVQVCVVSVFHIAPAFSTQVGRGRFSNMLAKVKAWWIARRG